MISQRDERRAQSQEIDLHQVVLLERVLETLDCSFRAASVGQQARHLAWLDVRDSGALLEQFRGLEETASRIFIPIRKQRPYLRIHRPCSALGLDGIVAVARPA